MKIRSAGYTGCATDENEIANVDPRPDGSGTWVRPDDFLTRLNVASSRTNDCPGASNIVASADTGSIGRSVSEAGSLAKRDRLG